MRGERGREDLAAGRVVPGGGDDQDAEPGQRAQRREQQGVERRVRGVLVVVAERQRHHVDLRVRVALGEGERLAHPQHVQRGQHVVLVDHAVRLHHAHGQDRGVGAPLVHQARDERAVAGLEVQRPGQPAGDHPVPLDVGGRVGEPDAQGAAGRGAVDDRVQPGVAPGAGVEDGHDGPAAPTQPGLGRRAGAGPTQHTGARPPQPGCAYSAVAAEGDEPVGWAT